MKERINHCFRLVLLFTLGNFFSVAAISQNLDLKGNVKDDKGTPLNSVNITIQGSTSEPQQITKGISHWVT